MTEKNHHYIVIMAGGSGTRLWPLSRKDSPKQFQKLLSEKTMIEETYDRAQSLVPADHIFVSTTRSYRDITLKILPQLTKEQILVEPEARNTGPAIALVATLLQAIDPEAVVATIASDHAIVNPEEFTLTMRAALATATQYSDKLVTVGINPTFPDTGLGYIKMGDERETIEGKRIFTAASFKEKPDQKTAEEYLATWEYLWNASYFVFRAATFARWMETFSPPLADTMKKISTQKKEGFLTEESLAALYQNAPAEPLDTLLVEKLSPEERLVIPSALKWSDVGNWAALFSFLEEKTDTSLVGRGSHIDLGSTDTLVYGHDKMIVTSGLEDMVIVDTADALLVAKKSRVATDIKKLVEKLKEESAELL